MSCPCGDPPSGDDLRLLAVFGMLAYCGLLAGLAWGAVRLIFGG